MEQQQEKRDSYIPGSQHLEEDYPKAPHVRLVVVLPEPRSLLGRYVRPSADAIGELARVSAHGQLSEHRGVQRGPDRSRLVSTAAVGTLGVLAVGAPVVVAVLLFAAWTAVQPEVSLGAGGGNETERPRVVERDVSTF